MDSFDNVANRIFKQGSTTYYYSSLFFPPDIKRDVFTLYAFVRTADDLVDTIPQQKDAFFSFVEETKQCLAGKRSENTIIEHFVQLSKRKNFKREWVDAFLDAMEADLSVNKYETFRDLESYIFGSAEVIGLMMSSIMNLSPEAHKAAQLQGKAMQFVNFIRDIREDLALGRVYMPQEDLQHFNLTAHSLQSNTKQIEDLVRFEIGRYLAIQAEAEKGYHYIPKRYRIPIKTAADMYKWTAQQIYKNPQIVFKKKVKPSKRRVVMGLINNILFS